MGLNKTYVEALIEGTTVRYRSHGNSMTPRIKSGDLVEVRPLVPDENPPVGSVVLCRVKGNTYLHLVTGHQADRGWQISNNHGHVNGWSKRIFGILTKVNPK